MGLFGKDNETKLRDTETKMRALAVKRGASIEGASYVATGSRPDSPSSIVAFVLFPDRIDLHDFGGAVTHSGKGVTSLPLDRVGSVQTTGAGLGMSRVDVHSTNHSMSFKTPTPVAEAVRAAVERAAGAQRAIPPQSAPTVGKDDPFEALAKLTSLRDSGIVSSAEYEAKKAELLERM